MKLLEIVDETTEMSHDFAKLQNLFCLMFNTYFQHGLDTYQDERHWVHEHWNLNLLLDTIHDSFINIKKRHEKLHKSVDEFWEENKTL